MSPLTLENILEARRLMLEAKPLGRVEFFPQLSDSTLDLLLYPQNVKWDHSLQRFISRTVYDDNGKLIRRNW